MSLFVSLQYYKDREKKTLKEKVCWDVFLSMSVVLHANGALPWLCWEAQHPPSVPPHFSLSSETSLSRLSILPASLANSAWQHEPPEEPGTTRIRWVSTSGELGSRLTSLPSTSPESEPSPWMHGSEISTLMDWGLASLVTRCNSEGTDVWRESRAGLGIRRSIRWRTRVIFIPVPGRRGALKRFVMQFFMFGSVERTLNLLGDPNFPV